ncbi:IclR family transcriptional regulator [Frondihabitans peucedani]|uniref:IclR family transcriptional regulator n=1 Tax=Frondihabitans peucedani TaxID=598626 RepID=A0ABP8E1J9_9MICO
MSQSLARALQLLGALEAGPRSLDDLAGIAEVHKTTVLRLLRTLEADRFVVHDEQHRYRLGSRVFELANAALAQRDVRQAARPHLERLNADTGQTVHLATREGSEVVYVDKIDAPQGVRMYSRIGLRAPIHCTAVGKVLAADLPTRQRDELLAGLDYLRFTPNTITTPAALADELDRVTADDWAQDHEEHEAFINCVGVPVRDGSGRVVAALSVSVPTLSLDHDGVLALLPRVRAAGSAVSSELGWAAAGA